MIINRTIFIVPLMCLMAGCATYVVRQKNTAEADRFERNGFPSTSSQLRHESMIDNKGGTVLNNIEIVPVAKTSGKPYELKVGTAPVSH